MDCEVATDTATDNSSQGRASTDRGVQRADRASAGWSKPTWMYGSGAEGRNRSPTDGMLQK